MTTLYELNIESLNSSVEQDDYEFSEELVRLIGDVHNHDYTVTTEQKLREVINRIKASARYKGVTEYGTTWCLFTVPRNFHQSNLFKNYVESKIDEKIRWCAIEFNETDPCASLRYLGTEQYVVFTQCGDFAVTNSAEYWLDRDEDGNLHFGHAAVPRFETKTNSRPNNIEDVAFWMAWLAMDEQLRDGVPLERMTIVVQTRANMYLKVLKMFWSNLTNGYDLNWAGVGSIISDQIKDWQP